MGQNNATTEKNTENIKGIINQKYDKERQEMNLCKLVFTQMVIRKIGGVR